MFSLPAQKELSLLRRFKEPHCVTIYLPYSKPVTTGTNPNYISLKNLIREASDALEGLHLPDKNAKKTLRPAHDLLASPALASLRDEGVVLFLHEKLSRIYKIPNGNLEPLIIVEYGFNIDPLIKILEDNAKYYLLALAHDNVRFFEGDHYSLQPIHLRNFPSSMVKALRLDEYEKWTESHTVAPPRHGRSPQSEAFHGQYNEKQVDKDELLQFFHLVNERLHKFLHAKRTPLVLAGVDYLVPIYRRANTYPYLSAKSIKGNTDHAHLSELQNKAWSIVSPQTRAGTAAVSR